MPSQTLHISGRMHETIRVVGFSERKLTVDTDAVKRYDYNNK